MPRKFVSVIGVGASEECRKIALKYRFAHLVVEEGKEAAKIVFADKNSSKNFVIENFPTSLDEYLMFEQETGLTLEFVLYLEGPAQQEIVEAAFLQHCESRGLLKKINPANYTAELQSILFSPLLQNELFELSVELLRAIDEGDYATYQKLCDVELTAFEPESQGQLVEGLPFHKFYFDMRQSGNFLQRVSTITAPKIVLLSDTVALVTCTRLLQAIGTPLAGYTDAYNETRVWNLRTLKNGQSEWKHVHFHRSRAPTNAEFYTVNR